MSVAVEIERMRKKIFRKAILSFKRGFLPSIPSVFLRLLLERTFFYFFVHCFISTQLRRRFLTVSTHYSLDTKRVLYKNTFIQRNGFT